MNTIKLFIRDFKLGFAPFDGIIMGFGVFEIFGIWFGVEGPTTLKFIASLGWFIFVVSHFFIVLNRGIIKSQQKIIDQAFGLIELASQQHDRYEKIIENYKSFIKKIAPGIKFPEDHQLNPKRMLH